MNACIFLITHIENISNMSESIFDKCLCDLEEWLFWFFEKCVDVWWFIETERCYKPSGVYQFTEDSFGFDYLRIFKNMSTRRDSDSEVSEVRITSHSIQLSEWRESFRNSHDINRTILAIQLNNNTIYNSMIFIVKIIRRYHICNLGHTFPINQKRTK